MKKCILPMSVIILTGKVWKEVIFGIIDPILKILLSIERYPIRKK